MSDDIGGPDKAPTAKDVVDTLRHGRWAIFCHEWADDRIDPPRWREIVDAAATEAGIDAEFVVIEKRSLTVVFNRAAAPSFEQVRDSVEVIERYRWLRRCS
ncbi:hypothetical protein [Amycolatopsis sp. NPDC059021]|uniref:hypothetical protein n=1 Tax=Amycolatopsis sp. NPDC059021 TaxID=3346704 RepID=UPI00366AC036